MQVTNYFSKGLTAVYVSGELTDDLTKKRVYRGEYQLVFFTPEMIINNKRWSKVIEGGVYTERLKAFVVNEAHCVKKWSVEQILLLLSMIFVLLCCAGYPFTQWLK